MLLDDSVSGVFSDEIDKSLNKKHKSTSVLLITENIFTKLGSGVLYCFITVSASVLKFFSLFIIVTFLFFIF